MTLQTAEPLDPQAGPRGDSGLYVYCFVPVSVSKDRILAGGTDNDEFFLCRAGEIAALVRRVSLQEWVGPDAEARLQDLAWVGPLALHHERVVESVASGAPVFPATFGTIFSNEESLIKLIQESQETIVGFLNDVADKREFAVKLYVDQARVEALLFEDHPALKNLPASPGARYLAEQRVRRDLGRQRQAWVREMAAKALEVLADVATDYRTLKALKDSGSSHPGELTYNWALLVELAQVPGLEARVELLNREFGEQGLQFRASGPWPPFSFRPSLNARDGLSAGP